MTERDGGWGEANGQLQGGQADAARAGKGRPRDDRHHGGLQRQPAQAFEEDRRGERFSLHAAYARFDEIGTWYGCLLLGLAGDSAVGLGIAMQRRHSH